MIPGAAAPRLCINRIYNIIISESISDVNGMRFDLLIITNCKFPGILRFPVFREWEIVFYGYAANLVTPQK